MTPIALQFEAAEAQDQDWLSWNHNRLDARLAALLIHICAGAFDEAARDFDTYRSELAAHLEEVEERLMTPRPGLSERERVLDRLEWKTGVRDLRRILQAIEGEVRQGNPSSAYDMIAALRHALRRQRRQEERLRQRALIDDAVGAWYRPDARDRH